MTTHTLGTNVSEIELENAERITNVSILQTVERIIGNSVLSIRDVSKGECTLNARFDAKAAAEEYIRALPVKNAFVSFASLIDNFPAQAFLAPKQAVLTVHVC